MALAVTFDAFGTLFDAGRDALVRVSTAIVEGHRPDLAPEAFLETWDRRFFAHDLDAFELLADVTEASLARAFEDHGIRADPGPYADLLEAEWLESEPYPEVRDVLSVLDGTPRGVVSNADDAFLHGLLTRSGLRFDVVVSSESARCYKPRPRIFELALAAMGRPAHEVVHVGDSLEADVAGASRLGVRTVWVNRHGVRPRPGDPTPDAEVPDLRRVPDLLDELGRKP
jgi:2-haloacid dehalogenase/putative hydrolase of the HAD superfamily